MLTYEYKVLMASWGIWVRLAADVDRRPPDAGKSGSDRAIHRGTLVWEPELAMRHIDSDETHFIGIGLELAGVRCPREHVTFRCLEFSLAPCDYQPEGLACAVSGLVCKYFEVEPLNVPVRFERAAKRYRFDFPDSVRTRSA